MNEIEELSAVRPKGAFYISPRVKDVGSIWQTDGGLVLELLREEGVLVVHGSGLCPVFGRGHFRMVFLPPKEVLEEALSKIEGFMQAHLSGRWPLARNYY